MRNQYTWEAWESWNTSNLKARNTAPSPTRHPILVKRSVPGGALI